MSSSISNLKALLPYSAAIALTGLLAPIALSFVLIPLASSPPLHAFAAGSALSSTSLGTVLAVLQPSAIGFDLRKTGFGTALLSAAVMDDIVAFILVKVLSILGSAEDASGGSLGGSIGRAIGVTIGLGLGVFATSGWILKPVVVKLYSSRRFLSSPWGGERLLLVLMALLFIGMVAAAGYGGTSPLYGAYIAGLAAAYLSDVVDAEYERGRISLALKERFGGRSPRLRRCNTFPRARSTASPTSDPSAKLDDHPRPSLTGAFEHYVGPVLTYLLLPLFFGSIGYSIPFVPLWRGRVIWRGIVYAVLMLLGKAFCGGWMLLRGTAGWRAAGLLGLAMISRGEIGLL
jgi:Kef-type K+ transport system membrane component KefB